MIIFNNEKKALKLPSYIHLHVLSSRFDFKGIIDYIFYSKQSMVPLGLLGPLSADWFKEHKVVGCPHPHVPSGKLIFTG